MCVCEDDDGDGDGDDLETRLASSKIDGHDTSNRSRVDVSPSIQTIIVPII